MEPHLGELFAVVSHEDTSFPGEREIVYAAHRGCLDEFEARMGTYEASPIDVQWIYPGDVGWLTGDRTTLCSYTSFDGTPLVGAVAAAATPLPGTDADVQVAGSCAEVVDVTLVTAQAFIDAIDRLTLTELDNLGPDEFIPGTERYLKRESVVALRAFELGCDLSDINDGVQERIEELSAESFAGTAAIRSFAVDGYLYAEAYP